MGMGCPTTLTQILNKTLQRFTDIQKFYVKKQEIKSEDKGNMGHSLIILLTLREIEITLELLRENEKKEILIPQYHFGFKKVYSFKFKNIKFESEEIKNYKEKITKIHSELQKYLDDGLIDFFGVSVIDNVHSPAEKNGFLLKIIETSFDSDLHQLYINYINEFIKMKIGRKSIYTNEALDCLKMARYITQILLFIKIYVKFNGKNKENLTNEEKKECGRDFGKDNIIFTYFILLELKKPQNLLKFDKRSEDNEKALEELVRFNKTIINYIDKIEKNIKNKN
jgi:hypothetical protein